VTSSQAQIDDAYFEARYRADSDPWRYETSDYERDKYQATLEACGPGPFRSAVELGGSIGVFSSLLASRCSNLVTLDFSATAARLARARLASQTNVQALIGRIPEDLPPGRFDLLVASEVLYYLTSAELDATVEWAGSALRSGGRVVCVHWLRPGPERPLSAEAVHARFADARTLIWTNSASTDDYLLDSFERR
jgi:predicted TPR repeat methyltransferase